MVTTAAIDGAVDPRAVDGYEPLPVAGLDQMLRQVCDRAGLVDSDGKARAYPHLLRHSFATWALSCGWPTQAVAHQLGHASLPR